MESPGADALSSSGTEYGLAHVSSAARDVLQRMVQEIEQRMVQEIEQRLSVELDQALHRGVCIEWVLGLLRVVAADHSPEERVDAIVQYSIRQPPPCVHPPMTGRVSVVPGDPLPATQRY